MKFGRLYHLIGMEVRIMVDNAEVESQVVDAKGQITLPDEYDTDPPPIVDVGLAYDCTLKTVPLGLQNVEAAGLADEKNISQVFVRVFESPTIQAGTTEVNTRTFPPRNVENWGDPPASKSQMLQIPIDPDWNYGGQVVVRSTALVPVTVSGLVLDFEV